MRTFLCVLLGAGIVLSVGYGAHNLACYAVIEPSGDYVQADSAIAPKLCIANFGYQAETYFSVEFIAINEEGEDTVFVETTRVAYIGPYPDSIEVELPEWTPEGRCAEYWNGGPFVYYDLLGVVHLETDEDRANDTLSDSVTCLLSHDVGVIDFEIEPDPDVPPCTYNAGSVIRVTAVVENFGKYAEHNVPVRLEILDITADPDTLVYNNIQVIASLDWRGDSLENPYTVEITFPNWSISGGVNLADFLLILRTEMLGDECNADDEIQYHCWEDVAEDQNFPLTYSLELKEQYLRGECYINFAVPQESWIKVDVFDVGGRWVKSITNDIFEAGHYSRSWNHRDAAGRKVASGVYLIRMQSDEFNAVRKVVIMN